MGFKYQLAIMGPGPNAYRRSLVRAVKESVRDLGLAPTQDMEIITSAKAIEKRDSMVGVWLAKAGVPASPDDLSLLDALLDGGVTVIPVVDSFDGYSIKVPPALKKINGVQDEPRIDVVQAVLRGLGLTRLQRQAFITYKRSDSTGVAIQVFDGLCERAYHAFLDTASIEIGEEFQSVLWDRISDADVHLFLDTPNALKSRWICEELARVNSLGLGVVQVVWPGHEPTPGTEFSLLSRRELDVGDFENGDTGVRGRLKKSVLKKILEIVEQSRISSLGLRRLQLIGELKDQAAEHKLDAVVQAAGYVELRRKWGCVALAFPIVGLPDAWTIHQLELAWKRHRRRWQNDQHIRVVFDGLGMRPERQNHLVWLNDSLRLKTITLEGLSSWWKELNGAVT